MGIRALRERNESGIACLHGTEAALPPGARSTAIGSAGAGTGRACRMIAECATLSGAFLPARTNEFKTGKWKAALNS